MRHTNRESEKSLSHRSRNRGEQGAALPHSGSPPSPRDFLHRAAESGPIPSIFLAAATTGLQKLPSIRPGLGKRGWGSGRRRGGSWRPWTGSARPTRRTTTSSRSPPSFSSSLPSASSSTASSSRCACPCRLSFFLSCFRCFGQGLRLCAERERVACCRESRLDFCWFP